MSDHQQTTTCTDYFVVFKNNYKKIIGLIGASIPFLGVVASFLKYIYYYSYYKYFMVNDNWNNQALDVTVYKLLYVGCFVFFALMFNIISGMPFILKNDTLKKLKYQCKFCIISISLFVVLAMILSYFSHSSFGKILVIFLVIWSVCLGMPIIIWILEVLSELISVFFSSPLRAITYIFKNKRIKRNIRTPLIALSKVIDKVDTEFNRSPSYADENECIENKNKGFILFILIIVSLIAGLTLYLSLCGNSSAKNKKSYQVIKYSTTEFEFFNDLREYDNRYNPYIKSVNTQKFRNVNSVVILAENDDSFLIANSYIDYKNNTQNNLYIFTDEQTIISKEDVLTNIISFNTVEKR